MISRAQLWAVIATLVFVLDAIDCNAQFGGRGSRGANKDQGNSQDKRNNRPAQQQSDSSELMEYRLSLLEEDLHLQSGQRASWELFADKVRAYAGDLARVQARAMTSSSGGGALGGVQKSNRLRTRREIDPPHLMTSPRRRDALRRPYAGSKMLADVRIATIIAPQSRAAQGPGNDSNLPDLGSSGRTQR
jgi:hypothetical protein